MFRIRRFGVVRTATVAALCYLVAFGLLFAIVMVIALAVGSGTMSEVQTGALIGGAVAAILIYALFGWVFTAVACLVYNFVARWAGGIEVEVERIGQGGPAAGYPYAAGPSLTSGTAPWAGPTGERPPGYQPNWTPPPTDRP